jgi:signal transduction histidine kinase/CheY-like chemotaxis protein/HPt (histidine-containing phosphotransfer) domain-containing protein
MKPTLLLLRDHPRLKKVLAFTFVAIILVGGIVANYAIESGVLQSAQEHSAQNDSVIKHQQYQQIVEKTMFLLTQSDHHLEDYVQSGDLHKKEAFTKNSTGIEKNLQEVKSTYAGYIPKYLVNVFVHKAANRVQLNRDIVAMYDSAGRPGALEMINSFAYRSSFKDITFGEQELVSALGIKIEQLNKKITIEKAEMVRLDRRWNIVSLIFMSLIALLVVYKMVETNRLNNVLSVAIQKGQQAQLVKDQFISNVTHELRTPLNSIIGYTNLLMKKDHAPETKQWIQSMKISGNLLMEVINDVLDYSKLESGHFQFSNEPFDVKRVMSNLNTVLQNRAEAKSISLHVEVDKQLPSCVSGDARKLMQILVNLTGNSIKFTEQGSVTVATKMVKQSGEKAWIQFTVSDTGIGIDKEKLPYVFERFYQIESKTSKKYYGTGLGLPIVKQLVEMQGGEIEVFSAPGEGTQFVLMLPYTIASASETEKEKEVVIDKEKFVQKKILIVDDNEMNRDLMGYLLAEHKFLFDKADSGIAALQLLKQKKYDFILMDIQMPGLSGIDTTKKIRAELNMQTPIIGLSAFCQSAEQQNAINAGMNAYLTKPVDERKLLELLNHYSDWDTEPVTPQHSQLKLVNIDYLQRLTGGNKENIQDLLSKAFDYLPGEVKRLQESFAAEDQQLIKETAHNMKSTLRILGVNEQVSSKVIQIEKGNIAENSEKERIKDLIAEIDSSVQVVLQELREYLEAA